MQLPEQKNITGNSFLDGLNPDFWSSFNFNVIIWRITVCGGDIFKPQIHTISRFTLASHSISKTDVFSLGLSNACFKASCLTSAVMHLHLLSCCTGSPDCNSREVSSMDAGEDEVFMVSKMGCTKQV